MLLVTFGVSSHQWGWYNYTKVYHPKLYQWGRILKKYWQQLVCGKEFVSIIFWGGWHRGIWSTSIELRFVNNSCILVLPCVFPFSPATVTGQICVWHTRHTRHTRQSAGDPRVPFILTDESTINITRLIRVNQLQGLKSARTDNRHQKRWHYEILCTSYSGFVNLCHQTIIDKYCT
jgi:hypothetical protein